MAGSEVPTDAGAAPALGDPLEPGATGSASEPRRSRPDADGPVDLGRLVRELKREGAIAPSRYFMRLVHEETLAARQAQEASEGSEDSDEAERPALPCPMLLTNLVTEVMGYCRIKCLELPEEFPMSATGDGAGEAQQTDSDLTSEDATPLTGDPTTKFTKQQQLGDAHARLLERCAEIYSQLLLVSSEWAATAGPSKSQRSPRAGAVGGSPVADDGVREKGILEDVSPRLAAAARAESEGRPKKHRVYRATWNCTQDARYCKHLFNGADHSPRKRTEVGATHWSTTRGDSSSGVPTNKHVFERIAKEVRTQNRTTPFFEAVYALVTRAAQQGVRQATESSKGPDKDRAQVALRVEEELGRIFRSNDFGRVSGANGRRGGARSGAISARVEEESAQLAARAEERIQSLMRLAAQRARDWDKWKPKAPPWAERMRPMWEDQGDVDEAKGTPAREDERLAAGENKDAVGGDQLERDLAAQSERIATLITGFRANAAPRSRRGGDRLESLRHVGNLRSPIMTSLLPSPRDQVLGVTPRRGQPFVNTGGATLRSAATQSLISPASSKLAAAQSPRTEAPALMNSWALTPERTKHGGHAQIV